MVKRVLAGQDDIVLLKLVNEWFQYNGICCYDAANLIDGANDLAGDLS